MKSKKKLAPKDSGALKTYAVWLASLVRGAQMLGCEINFPKVDIYFNSADDNARLDDPIEFTTELFRCGNELSHALMEMEGDLSMMYFDADNEICHQFLDDATKSELAAYALGMQYHAWYESTKYICCVVGPLCEGTPPWNLSDYEDFEEVDDDEQAVAA